MKHGFTLIELLVVVAVLAILIAISVPTFRSVTDLAGEAECRANVGQLANAFNSYYADRDAFPNAKQWVKTGATNPNGGTWPNGSTWASPNAVREGQLFPYVGSEKAYLCPSFEREYDALRPDLSHLKPYCGYVMNEYFVSGGTWMQRPGQSLYFTGKRPQILFSAHVAIIGEENTWKTPGLSNYSLNNNALGIGKWGNAGSIVDCMATIHREPDGNYDEGSSHVGFADGHAIYDAKPTWELPSS